MRHPRYGFSALAVTTLWLSFAVVIVYGSLYPFHFQSRPLDNLTLENFLGSCCQMSGRGDVLGNIVLFLPFGFLGMLAGGHQDRTRRRVRSIALWGIALALAVQVAQIYLPSRDENLQDVAWNLVGTLLGAWVGRIALKHTGMVPDQARFHLVPGLLIGAWLIYRLLPMVPSLDLQEIKDSLKPLLLTPQFSAVDAFVTAMGWLLVAALLQRLRKDQSLDSHLPLLILVVLLLEVVIVNNTVSASNVVGAGLALAVWWGGFRHLSTQAGLLAALLLVTIAVDGVMPLTWRPVPSRFEWLPFHGLLGGSMYVNVQAICQKVFLYGSLVFFLWQTRLARTLSVALGVAVLASVESMQTHLIGHTPEITDPLLLVLAALAMLALRESSANPLREEIQSAVVPATRPTRLPEASAIATKFADKLVDLRPVQAEFLENVAERMGASVTEVTQHILDDFISQYAADMTKMEWELRNKATMAGTELPAHQCRWVECKLILHHEHARFVETLSAEVGLSESRILRYLVARFMSEL